MGGSHYYKIHNELGANVPKVDIKTAAKIAKRIHQAISESLVVSCHDCSEGGLATALAEMAFAGDLGIETDLRGLAKSKNCIRTESQLFSESNSRYIVEVEPDKYDAFVKLMLNLPFGQIGKVTENMNLIIRDEKGKCVINKDIGSLKDAWQKPLDW